MSFVNDNDPPMIASSSSTAVAASGGGAVDTIATTTATSYAVVGEDNSNNNSGHPMESSASMLLAVEEETQRQQKQQKHYTNFLKMSVLFSANHGCVTSCLALATSQLGYVGAWQSGILYFTYTASAMFGATYIVKSLGARDALLFGMGTYCVYVGCFWFATLYEDLTIPAAYSGAILGGFGASLLWVAQGVYFSQSAENHAMAAAAAASSSSSMSNATDVTVAVTADKIHDSKNQSSNGEQQQEPIAEISGEENSLLLHHGQQQQQQEAKAMEEFLSDSNTIFAANFAFIYLFEEVCLRAVSTILLNFFHWSWAQVFALYTVVAVASTILMIAVPRIDGKDRTYDVDPSEDREGEQSSQQRPSPSVMILRKATMAMNLLLHDPKMKYMIGLNMVFGFASAFLNSYVDGEAVRKVLHDARAKYVGILSSTIPVVAAVMSLLFGKLSQRYGKGPILIFGAICFSMVVLPFMVFPHLERQWHWSMLLMIYVFHGTGRATFEGTLRATFADFFSEQKEAAFANIILQNGLSSSIGYILTFNLVCSTPTNYCVRYKDGTYHDVLTFEWLVILSAIFAIIGYGRAAIIHHKRNTNTDTTISTTDTL